MVPLLSFLLGVLILVIELALDLGSEFATDGATIVSLKTASLRVVSFAPILWVLFSLSYARGDWRREFKVWSPVFGAFGLVALGSLLVPSDWLVQRVINLKEGEILFALAGAGKLVHLSLLLACILVLLNLERTLRGAVGTARWRIKYVVFGVAIIFATRIYTCTQVLVFGAMDPGLQQLDGFALLLGCGIVGFGLMRQGVQRIEVYPSRSVIQGSVTLVLAGLYLLIVGGMAELLRWSGAEAVFPIEAFVLLVALPLLAALFYSERLRQKIRLFVSRHFGRAHFNYREIWSDFGGNAGSTLDRETFCRRLSEWVSQLFQALSVAVWIYEPDNQAFVAEGSTSGAREQHVSSSRDREVAVAARDALLQGGIPVELKESDGEPWRQFLKSLVSQRFETGRMPVCVPLICHEELLGVLFVADRVSRMALSMEELDLMKCIGDQAGRHLLNIRLSEQLLRSKELEAFQAMSTFFVHDLKNVAFTLSLMLENLPKRFEDPEFRRDALQSIDRTVRRIQGLIANLGLVRQQLELSVREVDLNELLRTTLKGLDPTVQQLVQSDLNPLPPARVDPDQMQSVVVNLLLNARDAVDGSGSIRLESRADNGWAVVSVSDTGPGMTGEFIQRSLFRPFRTTKKNGVGVGLFHARKVIEAHQGRIEVRSKPGEGTVFLLHIPIENS